VTAQLLRQFASRGISPGLILVASNEYGLHGGAVGSDTYLLPAEAAGIAAVSVGVEPGGVAPGVRHLPGGPRTFRTLLDEQLRRRTNRRVPAVDVDPEWVLTYSHADPRTARSVETQPSLGDGTLAASMGAYNPLSYHNGSVWPHDNAITVAGMLRYGFVEEAQRVALALLDAGSTFGARFPQLWTGFDRTEFTAALPYPTSCSPQAWAAATPFLLLRALLGLNPRLPKHQIALSPQLPAALLPLRIDNLRIGAERLRIEVDEHGWHIHGLPSSLQWIRALPD